MSAGSSRDSGPPKAAARLLYIIRFALLQAGQLQVDGKTRLMDAQ
jgi:hypothetical protein